MRKILDYLDQINDELYNAKEYAENYLQFKVEGNQEWSMKYKKMAEDELQHALNIRELAVLNMEKLKAVYTPPTSFQETYDKTNSNYIEKVAWIKQMLAI